MVGGGVMLRTWSLPLWSLYLTFTLSGRESWDREITAVLVRTANFCSSLETDVTRSKSFMRTP